MGPQGWINDPVAPYFDENTKTYHLFYQHHPQHIKWGNISNSHAVSKDMIFWHDLPNPLLSSDPLFPSAIVTSWVNRDSPNGSLRYDRYGVFSGGAFPNDPSDFSKGFSVLYTSVQELPTCWSCWYKNNTETVSLVETTDNGITWVKYAGNPVIPSPSEEWNITGWRDPLPILEADEFRRAVFPGDSPGTVYAVLAGGFKAPYPVPGPRLFLYKTVNPNAKHLTEWAYAGNLFRSNISDSWSSKWSGSFGGGFEMSGAFLLTDDDGEEHWCVSSSSQGDRKDPDPAKGSNWVWWGCGKLKQGAALGDKPDLDSSYLELAMVGVPDFGETYAYNTFLAPSVEEQKSHEKRHNTASKKYRRILLAWSFEDFTFDPYAFGWQGMHVLPREAYIWSADVLDPVDRVTEKGSWTATKNADGSYRVKTLAQRPVAETKLLFNNATRYDLADSARKLAPGSGYTKLAKLPSSAFKVRFELSPPPADATNATWLNGIVLRLSPTSGERTILAYDPSYEAVVVYRQNSSIVKDFVNSTEIAPLRLWTLKSTGSRQSLSFKVFCDNSLIEIYVNDVLTLTTRVYPWADDATEVGAWLNVGQASFWNFEAWDLSSANAFPNRPLNTSLPLVWDGPEVAGLWDGY
ncbi:glycoside hydrolase family 32 protein [Gonapodya prolifera JEL478]|uniref:Glycoside hydrolase family 32 protein n=1 Tax=Gonapodya prolifera (strain JEL478) TaxID=1344416 RepID=A0A139AA05_GONPJ|nr:glycoside hydrolase family 32 protein [Gonapodya prolifera JEL478]|eukprot:KXS13325.1 glycoside hydrolase family 32 protein [Gonapodya prolifera JEL478]